MRSSTMCAQVGCAILLACSLPLRGGIALAQSDVDEAALLASPRAEWLTYGGDYAGRHFSPLTQIDRDSVDRLALAWSWDITGTDGNLEATPIVVDGAVYATGTWSNVFALDAATGAMIWRWDPGLVRGGRARGGPSSCCGPVNRGVAVYGDRVYVGLLDGRLVALDRNTGVVDWAAQTTPAGSDYAITGAPRIVKGNVIIGNAGAEFGVRGYVTAYDADTGEEVWRFYTVPGNPADGFENEAMRRAAATWSGEWWRIGGGGTAWDSFAFDPETNLLYIGVGNGSPWNRAIRSPEGGDNLYLSSIVAVDADTGEYVWHYQVVPGDSWDYTASQPIMLLDLTIEGRERKVLVQAPKNGFFYLIDRITGELISARVFSDDVTWATGIDAATGRPIENREARYEITRQGIWLSPGPGGAHNWQPMSFNPATGLVYFTAVSSRYWYNDIRNVGSFEHRPGVRNEGVTTSRGPEPRPEPPPLNGSSALLGWDPVGNREVWRVPGTGSSATLSTAGGVLFRGSGGVFYAHDPRNGNVLWSLDVGGANFATPITYALGDRQYVAVEVTNPARVLAFALDRTREQ